MFVFDLPQDSLQKLCIDTIRKSINLSTIEHAEKKETLCMLVQRFEILTIDEREQVVDREGVTVRSLLAALVPNSPPPSPGPGPCSSPATGPTSSTVPENSLVSTQHHGELITLWPRLESHTPCHHEFQVVDASDLHPHQHQPGDL